MRDGEGGVAVLGRVGQTHVDQLRPGGAEVRTGATHEVDNIPACSLLIERRAVDQSGAGTAARKTSRVIPGPSATVHAA